ncbi:MAG: AAA family ATPase, partial [Leptospiraceae bacterium]|nr:AAA family ATPase [Leptospiraceae bacterium]
MIQIPGFEIKSEIYSSVRTRVYRGIRISDKKPVVLKLLNSDYPPPIEIARIKREFEIGSLLNSCPGILNYISLEKFDKHYIIISEDIGGVSLWKFIKSFNGSLIDIIKIFIKLGNGLSEIHNSKIIHKDLKPQNIIINPNNLEIQIIDFGISSVLTNESISIKSPDKLEGTLNYISPEQTGRMNRSVDYRTDFYSLGVTLYHWLVGRLPFYSEDSMGLIHSHIAKKTPTLTKESKFLKNLDDDSLKNLSKLIFKLTEKNSEDRYQSADGLVYDLKIILKSLEESGRLVEFIPGQNDFSKIFSIPQKILGREKEIEKLLQTFELASIGQKQFLIVKGFSGIGKSVLINEIHKPILIKKGYFLSGKFDQFKKDQPYSALKNAFNELIRQILTESKEKIENWRKIILAILGENAGVITEVITDLEFIIGKVNPPIPLT